MSARTFTDLLPGLYLLALTEGLALGLRRGFDPVPTHVRWSFHAVVVALFGSALFAGGVLLPLDNLRTAIPFRHLPAVIPPGHGLQGDLVHQIAPWLHLVRAATAEGGWPLWNQHVGAGMPLLADPQAQAFQPLVGATFPLPFWPAIGVLAALRVWLALAFTYLLLRRQGLGEPAACAGAFAYGCGGFLMLWLGWPLANVGALLPAVLYASTLCIDRGWRRDGALLALTVSAPAAGRPPRDDPLLSVAWILAASLLLLAQPEGMDRILDRVPGLRATLAHQNHRVLLLVSFALAYLAACELDRRLRGEHRGAKVAAAALVAVELVATFRSANPTAPQRLAYPRVEAVRFLTERAGNDRITGIGASVFSANFSALYGLRDARINNPALPYAYESATSPLQRRALTGVANFFYPAHPLYDLLGVCYVVTRPGVPAPLPLVFRHPTAWIYERPGALPRLFLPAHAKPHLRGSWIDFLSRNPDFATRALVEPEGGREGGRPRVRKAHDPGGSRLTLLSEGPTRIAARSLLSERRLLATGIFQDGHWRVLANGAPVPGLRTNGAFAGAWLPAGEWRIDLLYRPAPWVLGCLLCALALALGAALWVPQPARVVSSGLDASPLA